MDRRAQLGAYAELIRVVGLSQVRVVFDEASIRSKPGSPLCLVRELLANLPPPVILIVTKINVRFEHHLQPLPVRLRNDVNQIGIGGSSSGGHDSGGSDRVLIAGNDQANPVGARRCEVRQREIGIGMRIITRPPGGIRDAPLHGWLGLDAPPLFYPNDQQ
jgi:hypothetical protein